MYVGVDRIRKVFAAGILAGVASVAGAQSYLGNTDADYMGSHSRLFGSNISMTWGSNGNITGGSITAGAYGFMKWQDISSGDFAANGLGMATSIGQTNRFYTLCGQFVPLNDPSNFDVWDVSSSTSSPNLPSYRPYSLYRAVSVMSFDYDGAGGTGTAFEHAFNYDSALRGAGIQLAVWAAIYGTGAAWGAGALSGSTLTLTGFSATDTDGSFATVVGYARSYYEAARLAGWATGTNASTYWLDSKTIGNKYGQDQMTIDPMNPPQSVPEPFTMALMGGSAVAGFLRVRRRRQA